MRFETPFGPAWAAFDDRGALTEFGFREVEDCGVHNNEAARQINEFFAGKRQVFDLPLSPDGSAFQKRVWAELCNIPFGETISYGELAKRVGNPSASRAVGQANNANPIAVIVPCHRVIGASGKLVGYAGGLNRKEQILDWERSITGRAVSRALPPFQTRLAF